MKKIILSLMLAISLAHAQTTSEELFTAASQAFHNGFADVTIRYCEDFIKQFPQDKKLAEIQFLLGQSYFLKNRFQEALDTFNKLKDQPENQDGISFWLAESYFKLGDNKAAIGMYNHVIKDFPTSPFASQSLYSLGWLYTEINEYAKAQHAFTSLYTAYPLSPLAEDAWLKAGEMLLNDEDWQKAINVLKAYLDKYSFTAHRVDVLFNIGEAYYNLNNFSSALDYYQQAVRSDGDKSVKLSAYVGQLWALAKLGKVNELPVNAKVTQEFAASNGLGVDELALTLGNLFLEAGDYKGALEFFNDLIERHPVINLLDGAYLGRANAYFATQEYDAAKQDYYRVLDSTDSDISQKAHFGLGWLLIKQDMPQEAMMYFQAVADKTTDMGMKANALLQMADANQDAGKIIKALEGYQGVLAMGIDMPNKDYVLYRQSLAYLKADKPQEALTTLNTLNKLFPHSQYLVDQGYYKGVAAFKKGDWQVARDSMESFLKGLTKTSEFTPQANYILAISLLNLKQTEESLKVFQKILRIYPDNTVVAKNADLGIARCLVDLNQIKEAQKRFKLIAFKYPKTDVGFEALTWLAKNELKDNNALEAIEYYQQAVALAPAVSESNIEAVYYQLAQAYELLADNTKAIETYRKITKDTEISLKANIAIADLLAKDINSTEALNAYHQLIKVYPAYARDAFIKIGLLYRNSQQFDKELTAYAAAIKTPMGKTTISDAQLQFLEADALELMGRTDESIAKYLSLAQEKAQDLVWTVKAYLRVAKIYEDAKDWQGAKLTYQKVVSLNVEESSYAKERLEWIKNNAKNKR